MRSEGWREESWEEAAEGVSFLLEAEAATRVVVIG